MEHIAAWISLWVSIWKAPPGPGPDQHLFLQLLAQPYLPQSSVSPQCLPDAHQRAEEVSRFPEPRTNRPGPRAHWWPTPGRAARPWCRDSGVQSTPSPGPSARAAKASESRLHPPPRRPHLTQRAEPREWRAGGRTAWSPARRRIYCPAAPLPGEASPPSPTPSPRPNIS